MTQAARQVERDPRDFGQAREDSNRLWRGVLAALELWPEDAPLDAGAAPKSLDLGVAGRYLAGGASEFDCVAASLCAAGLRIEGPWKVNDGAWCVANLADIGIVEGLATQSAPRSFLLSVMAPPWRLQRVAQRLAWRIRRGQAKVEDRRRSERVEATHEEATLSTLDGRQAAAKIFDISEGGAALHLGSGALYFWIDQPVALNGRAGRVLRYFPGGLVIRFDEAAHAQDADS